MDFDDEDGWGRPGFMLWALALAVTLILGVATYAWIPAEAKVPIHFNIQGEADEFVPKGAFLFYAPGLLAGFGLVLDVIPFMPRPRKEISPIGKYLFCLVLLGLQIATVVTSLKGYRL